MICDLHVHTKYSCDSEVVMEEYCKKAIENNLSCICFTDHIDFNKNDYGFGYYNVDEFFKEYDITRMKFGNKIEVLCGIEFSEPHLYKKELKKLTKYPYDFIVGSIHWVQDLFPCQKTRDEYSAGRFYKLYWQEVLNAVEFGFFDCLGHIDIPKRYYGEVIYDKTFISKIFTKMKDNNIAMEVNTSSLRKGLSTSLPGIELLELYKNNGGKYVTIGSDAHVLKDLGADCNYAKSLIKQAQLSEVIFRQHKPFIIDKKGF